MDNIEKIYDKYSDVLEDFKEDVIKKRFVNLKKAYTEFLTSQKISDQVVLNDYLLIYAIMDYFTDIKRLKDFHQIQSPNTYKVKAYEISWLIRRKPLQILEIRDDLTFINEKFVLSYAADFLSNGASVEWYNNLSKEDLKKLNGYLDTLYYHFLFRTCDPHSIELAFLSFDAGVLIGKNPVKRGSKIYRRENKEWEKFWTSLIKEKDDKEDLNNNDVIDDVVKNFDNQNTKEDNTNK